MALDVNEDCQVTEADTRPILGYINSGGSSRLSASNKYLNTNGDEYISPLDILSIIDYLSSVGCGATVPPTVTPLATDTPTSTPTVTPTSSSTSTPTATQTSMPTPTTTPTATPPQGACQAYQLSVKYEGDYGRAQGGFWHLTESGSRLRSCLGKLVAHVGSQNSVDERVSSTDAFGDDYAIHVITGGDWAYGGYFSSSFLSQSNKPSVYATCSLRHGTLTSFCVEGQVYFDADCNRVPLANLPAQICDAGHVLWRASPISLNFAHHTTIDEGVTFVQFPLIPGESKRWFTWKASDSHPLLVIDPSHTGSITSSYQLLGNWSFGGYGSSLKMMLEKAPIAPEAAKPWRHGFEALATLDQDNNGAVTGAELSPLALWFDSNRNGVSDAGEVRTLSDVGIVSLFYKDPRFDQQLDGYHLELGFERIVDGKPVQGSAFDWFSPGDPSKEKLITSELVKQLRDIHGNSPRVIDEPFFPQSEADRTAAINGSWEWLSDLEQNPTEPSIGGILNMVAFKNGELRGLALSESQYAQPYALNSVVNFNAFKGSLGDERTIKFTVASAQWTLESSATLSADGATLIGKTTASKADSKRSFSYPWRAKKKA